MWIKIRIYNKEEKEEGKRNFIRNFNMKQDGISRPFKTTNIRGDELEFRALVDNKGQFQCNIQLTPEKEVYYSGNIPEKGNIRILGAPYDLETGDFTKSPYKVVIAR